MEINKPVAIVIILVISLISIFFFALPKYRESRALRLTLDEKLAEYQSKSAYYEKMAETIKTIESNKEAVEKINSALPDNFYFAPLVYFLQKKTSENGLISKSLTFSQSVSSLGRVSAGAVSKEIKNVSFTLNLTGSYKGLKNFLLSLEKSSRLFEVRNISFVSLKSANQLKNQPNQLKNYDFKLEVVTHSY